MLKSYFIGVIIDGIIEILRRLHIINRNGSFYGNGFYSYSGWIGKLYGRYLWRNRDPHNNVSHFDIPRWYSKKII